jgi:SprT protein
MPQFRQLELISSQAVRFQEGAGTDRGSVAAAGRAFRRQIDSRAEERLARPSGSRRDFAMESQADHLLRNQGARRIAAQLRVVWNSRLKSCAGRADYKAKLILLNPLLLEHGAEEVNRTFLHELAHILAQYRAGRRRIAPHGAEWRGACHDLGIGDEKRCHNLPFPIRQRARRFQYRCPNCHRDFPRVRRLRRAVACLACCRSHNRGKFDARFKLCVVNSSGGV